MKGICVVFFTILIIKTASAIKCWECTSNTNPNCADSFNNSTFPLIDCNLVIRLSQKPINTCRKIVSEMNGKQTFIRGCGYADLTELNRGLFKSNITVGSHHVDLKIHVCEQDGCNSASNLYPQIAIVFALVSILVNFVSI